MCLPVRCYGLLIEVAINLSPQDCSSRTEPKQDRTTDGKEEIIETFSDFFWTQIFTFVKKQQQQKCLNPKTKVNSVNPDHSVWTKVIFEKRILKMASTTKVILLLLAIVTLSASCEFISFFFFFIINIYSFINNIISVPTFVFHAKIVFSFFRGVATKKNKKYSLITISW